MKEQSCFYLRPQHLQEGFLISEGTQRPQQDRAPSTIWWTVNQYWTGAQNIAESEPLITCYVGAAPHFKKCVIATSQDNRR